MDLAQYEALLTDAETRLDRLRALYDLFFQGLERTEPAQLRKDFERILTTLRKDQPRNTALRFRFQMLVQRNVTLSSMWRKVMQQIEDGTYRRDVLRARRRRQGRTGGESIAPQVHEIDMTMDVDGALDSMFDDPNDPSVVIGNEPIAPLPPPKPSSPPPAPRALSPFAAPSLRPSQIPPALAATSTARASQRPAASKSFHPPKPDPIPAAPRVPAIPGAPRVPTAVARPAATPASAHRPAPPATPPQRAAATQSATASARDAGGFSQNQMKHLFDRYVDARKGNNERTDNLRMESLQKTVEAMLPKLREKHGGKQIDFDVVVRDGKVALKPTAR